MITVFKEKYQSISLFLFTSLLFIVVYSCFNIRFEENDDVLMALIASGEYGGTPDYHLVFSNVIYGYFLKSLYTIFPGLEWYTIIQVTLNILSTTILSRFIAGCKYSGFIKTVLQFFLYSIFIAISIKLQFTYSAGILGIAGASLLYRNSSVYKVTTGLLLLILSSFIRFEAPLLVLLISGPIIFIHLTSLKDMFKRPSVWGVGLAFLMILGGRFIDRWTYSNDAAWDYYWTYNIDRGDINDNPNVEKLKKKLPEHVTIGDYNLLLTAFADAKQLNLEVVSDLKSRLERVPFSKKILNLKKLFKPYYLVWLGVMCIISILFIKNKRSLFRFIPLMMYCILLAGLSYLALELTVKNRVFVIAFGTYLLLLPFVLKSVELNKKNKQIIGGLILFLTLFLNYRTIFRYDGNQFPKEYTHQQELLSQYLDGSDKKLTPYATSIMLEYGNPFHISKDYYNQQMYFAGWFTQIPFNKGQFDSFGFFLEGNGLFITKKAYQSVIDIVVENLNVNYHTKVRPEIVLETETHRIVEFVKN